MLNGVWPLEAFCQCKGLGEKELLLFIVSAGEAMTNAIKHAGAGKLCAAAYPGCLWAAVSDKGPGIAALTIPKATLRPGFSTKASLGMGYTIILDGSDKVALSTGPDGTTVVLMKNLPSDSEEFDEQDDVWERLRLP